MLKVLNVLKPSLRNGSTATIIKRTFLSQAYYCNEVWSNRLNNPLLSKINLDELYHELDQRHQRTGLISAVDVDLFANATNEDVYIDELMDLTHKLRLSADTSNTLNSTSHAVIRCLLDSDKKDELLNALDDRLNYGIFLDYYTANLLMDKFYKSKDYTSGARVASQLMLQEEVDHKLYASLGLLHCYNFLLNPIGWPEPVKLEEPEEEVKIRVKYLRNPYNDDHFDLTEPNKIVGKTIAALTKDCKNGLEKSLHILGLGLYGKHEKAIEVIKQVGSDKLIKEVLLLLPEDNPTKAEVEKLQTESADVNKLLETLVKDAERSLAEKDVASQCEIYASWEKERKEAIDRQKERILIAKRIKNIETTQEQLKSREEKLWFFENEEQIELDIEAKQIYYPKRWFGKKLKPRTIDEGYVPPEISNKK